MSVFPACGAVSKIQIFQLLTKLDLSIHILLKFSSSALLCELDELGKEL